MSRWLVGVPPRTMHPTPTLGRETGQRFVSALLNPPNIELSNQNITC